MPIIQRIRDDWRAARVARDTPTATTLGTLISAVDTKSKTFNPARDLTDAEVIAEVKKMLDGLKETAKFLAADDPRMIANAAERACLEEYMPRQMSEAEIRGFAIVHRTKGMDMGKIMAALKAERPGMYDGRLASQVVKQVLAG